LGESWPAFNNFRLVENMLSNVYEEEIDLGDLLQQQTPVEAVPLTSQPIAKNLDALPDKEVEAVPLMSQPSIPLQENISAIVEATEPPPLREVILRIFTELARLLNYLELIAEGINQDKTLQKTTILFRLVNEKAQSFLGYLNANTASVREYNEELGETLESISFAIAHELNRVYKEKVPAINSTKPSVFSRAELTWIYGLLHNCFQQSTITLVQAFDPSLDGSHLFEDYKLKLDQSVILYRELSELLRHVNNAEKSTGLLMKLSFINHLQAFRNETMHFLMYRDWETFEKFVDEIIRTYNSMEDLSTPLHRFGRYLETLLKHVGMRSVLIHHQKKRRGEPVSCAQ
jgi:hypothetical protein